MKLVTGLAVSVFVLAIGCDGSPVESESLPPGPPSLSEVEPQKPSAPEVKAPVGAEIVIDTLEEGNGNVYRTGRAQFRDAADESLLQALIVPDLDRGLGMKTGSCEAIAVGDGKTPAGVTDLDVGPKVTLSAAGSTPIELVKRTKGDGYSIVTVAGPPSANDAVPANRDYVVLLAPESDDVKLGDWNGVFKSAPAVDVQSDDFKKMETLPYPSGGYRLQYAPSDAQLATVTIGGGYSKTLTMCRLDPRGLDFTIQQSVLDSMKASLTQGDVIIATLTFWAYARTNYKHDAKLRQAIAVHRRMRQLAFKTD